MLWEQRNGRCKFHPSLSLTGNHSIGQEIKTKCTRPYAVTCQRLFHLNLLCGPTPNRTKRTEIWAWPQVNYNEMEEKEGCNRSSFFLFLHIHCDWTGITFLFYLCDPSNPRQWMWKEKIKEERCSSLMTGGHGTSAAEWPHRRALTRPRSTLISSLFL